MGWCDGTAPRGALRCGQRWWWAVTLAAAVVVVMAAPATAQAGCGIPAARSWTRTEKAVWRQLCAGEWADLNAEGQTLDPAKPDGWDDRRVISSAFVEQLLTTPYAAALDRHGIRLRGAWLPGGLDLSEATTSFPLRCQRCRIAKLRADNAVIDGVLDLRRSAIEGDLSLADATIRSDLMVSDGAVVSGALNADQLTVAGSLFLREGSKFNEIRLLGADIGGNLDASGGSIVSSTLNANRLKVAGSLFLREGSKFTDIVLRGADIGGNLEVDKGSVVSGALNADRLKVAGNVLLRDKSQFNNIDLLGADIGGQLSMRGGSVASGALNADQLKVASHVLLREGSKFTDIVLRGADIGGNLEVDKGSVMSGALNADQLTVAGSLFLREGSKFNNIVLRGADIGGQLAINGGSIVSGALNADQLTVAENVLLHDKSQFNTIDLLGADIGGQLAINGGSAVSGALNADQLTVAENVFLSHGSEFNNIDLSGAGISGLLYLNGAKWASDGSLDLSQAHVGGFFTDDRAESWPATLRLDGLRFAQWANPDPRTLGSSWFIGTWLARLEGFSPGPYTQLAAVMDASGHPTIAADIRYHRSHAESQQVGWDRPERWGRAAHWLVLGYGFRPWRALGWFLAAWLTGFLVFGARLQRRSAATADEVGSRPGRLRRWRGRIARVAGVRLARAEGWSVGQAALFSLDRLLPAFKLINPDDFPLRTQAQQTWSVIQILLGWLLLLFIGGWLGSLLVQP